MKIKWRIVLASIGVIAVLTVSVLGLTNLQVSKLITQETQKELTNYASMGREFLDAAYPGEWSLLEGKIYKGDTLMNDNFELVDRFTQGTDVLATIFAGDTRVSTTVKDAQGQRMIGTQASEAVIQEVLTNGKPYQGTADIVGQSARTYYEPILDAQGNVIGMWVVGVYTTVVTEQINSVMVNLALLAAGLLVAACVVSYLLGDSISKGIAKIKEKLHAMEEGQFSHAFDTKLVKRKDEIGEIARSAKNMQDRIGDIIRGIQTESQSVKHSSKNSLVHIEEIHDNVQDISATTQELSAGMEETSASTEEMNASTYEVEAEIAGMKTNTGNGEQLAVEIKKRADLLKQETLASQKNALDIYDATNVQLRESIKKTEAIEEIKELSQTILKITAQTNLLALNASIEAARAGEAGKGFAVVADQIRVLAENSKQAVSRINIITTNVSEAVSGVVEDSQRMLQFVDGQVLKDYERFVDTSNQYYADAEMVQKVVFDINESAAQLYETIQQIRMAIDEVTTATGEGAEGTTGIADKLSSIALKTNEVLEQAQGNRESAERLDQMVEFFQIS